MPDYIVRPATQADRAGIDELLSCSYPPLLAKAYDAQVLAAALPAMTRANPKLLDRNTWFVALAEHGQVVGCGGWTPERPGTNEIEPGRGHVRHFGTHVDHTRQGIARSIAEQMLASARAAKLTTLECYSTLTAEPLYGSLGFRTIESINVPIPRLDRPGESIDFPSRRMLMTLAPP